MRHDDLDSIEFAVVAVDRQGLFWWELERTFFNHLAAAQRPDGAEWCYYTALEGTKPYGPGINCCVSSGPRGMALVPQQAYFKKSAGSEQADVLVVNLIGPSEVTLPLDDCPVRVEQQNGSGAPEARRSCSTWIVRRGLVCRSACRSGPGLWK